MLMKTTLISMDELRDSVKENTLLVVIMHVNNETGVIQPIREIGKFTRENMPPSIILVGRDDSVTPAYQSKLFHKNMLSYNNDSYLYIYDGVGHLFYTSRSA